MTLFWIKIGLAVALVVGVGVHFKLDRDRAKELVLVTKSRDDAQAAASANATATENCLAVNAANIAEANRQAFKAKEAEIRLAAANASAGKDVERIRRDENEFRARGADCPAVDADFRSWLRGNP